MKRKYSCIYILEHIHTHIQIYVLQFIYYIIYRLYILHIYFTLLFCNLIFHLAITIKIDVYFITFNS